MDINLMIESLIASAQSHLSLVVAGGILLILLLYRKPKLAFALLGIAALLFGILLLISNISSSGVAKKENMVTERSVGDDAF